MLTCYSIDDALVEITTVLSTLPTLFESLIQRALVLDNLAGIKSLILFQNDLDERSEVMAVNFGRV